MKAMKLIARKNELHAKVVAVTAGALALLLSPIVAQAASDEEAKEQAELRKALAIYLSDTSPRPVKIVADTSTGVQQGEVSSKESL